LLPHDPPIDRTASRYDLVARLIDDHEFVLFRKASGRRTILGWMKLISCSTF